MRRVPLARDGALTGILSSWSARRAGEFSAVGLTTDYVFAHRGRVIGFPKRASRNLAAVLVSVDSKRT